MHSKIKHAIALSVCAAFIAGCAPFKHQNSGFQIIAEAQGETRNFYNPDDGGDSLTDRAKDEKYVPAVHYSAEFEYPTNGEFQLEVTEKFAVDTVTGHNRLTERRVVASGSATSTDATLTNVNAQDRSGEVLVAGTNAAAAIGTAGVTTVAEEAGDAVATVFAEGNKSISEGVGDRAGTPNNLPAIADSLSGNSVPERTEDNTEEVTDGVADGEATE